MPNLPNKAKPKRRWLQFSIRTMLVVVSLSCIALTIWVVPLERQRRAVAAIQALGGRLRYVQNKGKSESSAVSFLRRWLPQSYFDEVDAVNFVETQITDSGLAHLEGLTGLQGLVLANTEITDAGLAHLEELTGLQILVLANTHVTDAGLVYLRKLTGLQKLYLHSTQVTDSGLVHLHGLTGLKSLSLHNTQVTDEGLAQLRKALPNCQIIGP